MYADPNVLPILPSGVTTVSWNEALSHDSHAWSKAFVQCWPEWKVSLRRACVRYGMPRGAFERLSLHVLVNSQILLGMRDLLPGVRATPSRCVKVLIGPGTIVFTLMPCFP